LAYSLIPLTVLQWLLVISSVRNTIYRLAKFNLKKLELRDWRFLIIDYALYGILSDDPKEAASVRQRSTRFYYDAVVKMYRRSYDGILLRCLSNSEAREVFKEAHDDICGAHQSGPKLKDRLYRLGYYCPTMITDAVEMQKGVSLSNPWGFHTPTLGATPPYSHFMVV